MHPRDHLASPRVPETEMVALACMHMILSPTCTGNGNGGAAGMHVILSQPTCSGNGNGGAAGIHVILTQPTCSGNGNGGTAGIHVLLVVQLVLYTEGYLSLAILL